MRLRHAFAAALLAVAATAGCGSSDDTAGDQNEDDQQAEGDPGQDPGQGDGADTDEDNGDNAGGGGDGGQAGEPGEAPPEVGSVVEGIAVATVSGTPDEPNEQSGDVKRIGQDCFGEASMAGLEAGAAVTILDGSTGEEVGGGQIESTSAVDMGESSDGTPVAECSFHITATMSRTPASIRVQVGDLEPWDVQGSINDFVVSVPSSGDSSVDTTPPPEPTEPPVDPSLPPTDPLVTSPST